MDFKDVIKLFSERIEKLKDKLATEEATKNALILPFLTALGYDVFDPTEILPEMDCDLIKKKGEKIDYAIIKDGEPVILIECKHWQANLTLHDNQLQKYFVASKAKFGVLTNGIIYRFYTDLNKANIMDDKPFLEIDLLDLKDHDVEELKKFHKSYFDVDSILSAAGELKYMSELKSVIATEFATPSQEFVRYFGKQVYEGQFTPKIAEQFTELLKRTINAYINDMISDRLKAVIKDGEPQQAITPTESEPTETPTDDKIITTEEELEGFYIIKSILRNQIPAERITYRDAQTYFAVFIDDNNLKPVCRLYLNSPTNKRIALFDGKKDDRGRKQTIQHKINSIDEIYNFTEQLVEAVTKYL